MRTEQYYKAIRAGREVVILGQHNENTTVFWMNDGVIHSWNRSLGMMTRDDMTAERFTDHCARMREANNLIYIRG